MATFFDLQKQNRRRTKYIIVGFVMFFIWLGAGLDLVLRYYYGLKLPPIGTIAVGVGGVIFTWQRMYTASETVLSAMGAKRNSGHSLKQTTLQNVVDEMCIAASMPRPRVWIIQDMDPNAMALGLEDEDYHIVVTEGLLKVLDRDELQGVIAHELAHLKNQDTRLMTTLTVLIGFAALITDIVRHSRIFRSRDKFENGKIGVVILVIWSLSVLIAPLVTKLMALMVSREREFLADVSSAQFTRNPEALARALQKIAFSEAPTRLVHPSCAHLCIAAPDGSDLGLKAKTGWFATHPPIITRINRLMEIGRTGSVLD
ncbi:MAG: hypothetical protein CO167_00825 [Candidatus Marinimicrobia bacterium CG_4_9_14_3_um_filter_48_9]|nr:MAG: hypothetical protein CO167_00825 [Candidatus Marinimicrobia bacterium CG_4_9_14_3_um_filter_48_9]